VIVLSVLLAAVAAALAVRPPPRLTRPRPSSGDPAAAPPGGGAAGRWRRSPWLAAAVGAGAYRWVAGAEPGTSRRRRAEMERDLPLAVDLLVACVAAGRSPAAALVTVAEVLPGGLGERLRAAAARLALGADHEVVWRDLAADPALAPLGHTLARSTRTGAAVTTALARCAEDVRRQRRARAETVARSVGVRAAAPLGACFLPAFLLVGVVPTIVGSFDALAG
jgi:Flp pilus assembly protein TadB